MILEPYVNADTLLTRALRALVREQMEVLLVEAQNKIDESDSDKRAMRAMIRDLVKRLDEAQALQIKKVA